MGVQTAAAERQAGMKRCGLCRELKPLGLYSKDSGRPDGLYGWCKPCAAQYGREKRQTPRGIFQIYKSNARRRDLAFDMGLEEFKGFWAKPCTYCGDAIKTIGLDRIDNREGYFAGNVVPCCRVCNAMKSEMSMNQFIAKCRQIANSAIACGGR